MLPLTELVVDYIRSEGIEVQDFIALEIPDNLEVAAQDPMNLVEHINKVDTNGADAVVLSACVQMPSLEAIQVVEDRLGIPVLSAAVATAWQMLTELGRAPEIPGAGCLLRPKNHRSNGIGSMVRNAMSDDAFVRSSGNRRGREIGSSTSTDRSSATTAVGSASPICWCCSKASASAKRRPVQLSPG